MQSGWRTQAAAYHSLTERSPFGKVYFCFFLSFDRLFSPLRVFFALLRHIVKRNPSCKEVVKR